MAKFGEKLVYTESFLSGADNSSNQYRFMKLDADGKVIRCSAVTDVPIGVLLNKPDAEDKEAMVLIIGRAKISADGAINEGALVGTSADGQCGHKTPGTNTAHYIVGHALTAVTAAGQIVVAAINCASPARAA